MSKEAAKAHENKTGVELDQAGSTEPKHETLPGSGIMVHTVKPLEIAGFKLGKRLTMPQLKFEDHGMQLAVKVMSTFYVGKEIKEVDPTKPKQLPPTLVRVLNLQDGQEYEMVANAVIKDNLESNFPDGSYVGVAFLFQKLPSPSGKRYNAFNIGVLEVDE